MSNHNLTQYDLDLNIIISSYRFYANTNGWRLLYTLNDMYQPYKPFPDVFMYLKGYKFDLTYPVIGAACL